MRPAYHVLPRTATEQVPRVARGQNLRAGRMAFATDVASTLRGRARDNSNGALQYPAMVVSRACCQRANRTIASIERSTSASVVAQHETLMRIATLPCHTVSP